MYNSDEWARLLRIYYNHVRKNLGKNPPMDSEFHANMLRWYEQKGCVIVINHTCDIRWCDTETKVEFILRWG